MCGCSVGYIIGADKGVITVTRLIAGVACAGACLVLVFLALWLHGGASGTGILFVLLALCFLFAAVVMLPSSVTRG